MANAACHAGSLKSALANKRNKTKKRLNVTFGKTKIKTYRLGSRMKPMVESVTAHACAAGAPLRTIMAPQYIICDSGSGVHIVGRDELPRGYARHVKCAERPYRLKTANGRIKAQSIIELENKSLGSPFEAVILDNSPCAISLGRYCQDLGYSFHWPRGSDHPYMVNSAGHRVNFTAVNYVPYVDSHGEVDGFVNEVVPPPAAPAAGPDEAAA